MTHYTFTGNPFIDTCISILITYWPSLLLGVKTVLLIAISGYCDRTHYWFDHRWTKSDKS